MRKHKQNSYFYVQNMKTRHFFLLFDLNLLEISPLLLCCEIDYRKTFNLFWFVYLCGFFSVFWLVYVETLILWFGFLTWRNLWFMVCFGLFTYYISIIYLLLPFPHYLHTTAFGYRSSYHQWAIEKIIFSL